MGPISKVRRLFLPLVYSNDKVDMQLNHIKRVDDDKVKFDGSFNDLLTRIIALEP